MQDFPQFIKNKKNKIKSSFQYTQDIEGYIYDGIDGSQVAFWVCHSDRQSKEHKHNYDEYLVVVEGKYTVIMNNKRVVLKSGEEFLIEKDIVHSGECIAGTRVINAFGGKRAEREES